MNAVLLKSLLIFTILGVSACSKKDDYTASPVPGDEVKNFKSSYQYRVSTFTGGECTTELQEFESDSQSGLQEELCRGLQDESLNNGCALSQRKILFNDSCPGQVWKSTNPLATESSTPSLSKEVIQYLKVSEALEYRLVDEIKVSENLSSDENELAKEMSQALLDCGVNQLGVNCFEYMGPTVYQIQESKEDILWHGTLIKVSQTEDLLLWVYSLDKEMNPKTLDLYFLEESLSGDATLLASLESDLVKKLLSAKVLSERGDEALERLQNPQSLRQMYHMAQLLLNEHSHQQKMTEHIIDSIEKGLPKFIESGVEEDLSRIARLALSLKPSEEQLLRISEILLTSKIESIAQLAATEILNLMPERQELKGKVRLALEHNNASIRQKALTALGKAEPNKTEQNLILKMMEDEDYEVRKTAADVSKSLKLNDENFSVLFELFKSPFNSVRISASQIAGSLTSLRATNELIFNMNDSSYEVRKEVYTQLEKKTLTEKSLSSLKGQLKSPIAEVRIRVLKLIAKINSEKATEILISQLSDDSYNVRSEAVSLLKEKEFNDSNVVMFKNQLSAPDRSVRIEILRWLSSIESRAATITMIEQYSDDNYDVRSEVSKLLSAKKLDSDHISSLAEQLRNSDSGVRSDIVQFLNSIQDSKVTKILILASTDDNYDVRMKVSELLRSRKPGPRDLESIKTQLGSQIKEVRMLMIHLLGELGTPRALKILKDQLEVETQRDVKIAIEQTMQKF